MVNTFSIDMFLPHQRISHQIQCKQLTFKAEVPKLLPRDNFIQSGADIVLSPKTLNYPLFQEKIYIICEYPALFFSKNVTLQCILSKQSRRKDMMLANYVNANHGYVQGWHLYLT